MRKSHIVLVLLLCCALAFGVLGCFGGSEPTTTVRVTTTTLAPTTTTAEVTTTTASTTTTTTEVPGSWTALSIGDEGPGPRMGGSLAWVPTSGRLYLFGGWDGTTFSRGIWSFDPTAGAWKDRDPAGAAPSARAMQSMAYVPASATTKESLIVFGGYDGSGYLSDTWAFDLAEDAWTNLAPAGASPSARDGHSLAYDPVSGRVILFGGWDGTTQFGDTWAYDPAANTWAELQPAGDAPAARDSQAMTYDPVATRVVIFGGWSQTAEFSDTWLYDPAANTWTKATLAEGSPPARALAQMVGDSKGGRIVLFGGGTAGNVVLADTWIYNPAAGTWNQVTPGGEQPAARTGHAMAYDPATGIAYLFGGSDGSAFFNDVWTYVR